MKRLLACITFIALLITAFPVIGFAEPDTPVVTYTKADIWAAVDGMGRMPADYYNLAGIGLDLIPDVTPSQAENFTKKLYTVWAFLEKYAYTYNGNASLRDVMTETQWNAIWSYIGRQIYNYESPALADLLWKFLATSKVKTIVKTATPQSLLGIKFDEARAKEESIVKIYTTANIDSGVVIKDRNGNPISRLIKKNNYSGTLATFNEHILAVTLPYAGRNGIRVCGVDSRFPDNFYSTYATASAPTTGGSSGKNKASVTKLSASTATLGNPNTISVTTNATAEHVKITDKNGKMLAVINTPSSSTSNTKKFTLDYCFPKAGTHYVRAYAGIKKESSIQWNSTYKTAKVTVKAAASDATISKVRASTSQYRGQEATIKVTTSSKVTRVRLFDSSGNIVGFTRTYQTSGKNRVFSFGYTKNTAGKYKVSAQAGNELDWNSAKKSVTITFSAPAVKSISAPSVLRGTPANITVTGSATAQVARLLDSNKQEVDSTMPDASGKFVFTWDPQVSGKKTFYVQVNDGFGWSSAKAAVVNFKAPTILKVTATKVPAKTYSTITVKVPDTVTQVALYNSSKKLISTYDVSYKIGDAFIFQWMQTTKGKKTVYLRIHDGFGWSGYYKSSVTFT